MTLEVLPELNLSQIVRPSPGSRRLLCAPHGSRQKASRRHDARSDQLPLPRLLANPFGERSARRRDLMSSQRGWARVPCNSALFEGLLNIERQCVLLMSVFTTVDPSRLSGPSSTRLLDPDLFDWSPSTPPPDDLRFDFFSRSLVTPQLFDRPEFQGCFCLDALRSSVATLAAMAAPTTRRAQDCRRPVLERTLRCPALLNMTCQDPHILWKSVQRSQEWREWLERNLSDS